MPNVEIYTSPWCGYCSRAKALLARKGIEFTEIDVTTIPGKRQEMIARAGGAQTVPQIFIDGRHVGGSDDVHRLDEAGELDRLLGLAAGGTAE